VKQLKQGEQAATSRDAQRSMPQDAMPPASASAHNESEETTVKPYDPYLVPPMPSEAEAMELFFPSAKPKPPGPNDPPERPESGPAGTPSPHDIPAKPATAPKQLQTDSSEPFSPPATPAKEDASSEQEENETAKPYSPFAAMLDLDDFFEQQEQVARDKQKRGRRRKSHQKQAPEAVEQADNAHDTAKQSDQPIAEGNKDFIYGNPFDGTLPDIFQDDEALKRLVKEQGSKKPPAEK